jgi:hypothetical protein
VPARSAMTCDTLRILACVVPTLHLCLVLLFSHPTPFR